MTDNNLLLDSDDDPNNNKPYRQHDLTGQVIHEVVVEACIATTSNKQKKWRCLCLSCGSVFARTTNQLTEYRQLRSNFACSTCLEELRSSLSAQVAESKKAFFRELWDKTGTLYGGNFDAMMSGIIRDDFCNFFGWVPEEEGFSFDAVQVEHEPTRYRYRIQNIFELYPVRVKPPSSLRCGACGQHHQCGFACTGCRLVVCQQCVRSEEHACEIWHRNSSPGHGQYDWFSESDPVLLKKIIRSSTSVPARAKKLGSVTTISSVREVWSKHGYRTAAGVK